MLKVIKNFLGKECTFLAFSKEKLFNHDTNVWEEVPCIKVHYKKDKVTMPLYKDFNRLEQKDYEYVYNVILNQSWKQKQE